MGSQSRVLLLAAVVQLMLRYPAAHTCTPAAALAAAAGPAARATRHRNIATLQTLSSSRSQVQQDRSFPHSIGAFVKLEVIRISLGFAGAP
jgi:hypothetical protein